MQGNHTLLIVLFAALGVAACSDDRQAPASQRRVASQLVLTEPPYDVEGGGFGVTTRWRYESTESEIVFRTHTDTVDETLDVPGDQVMFARTIERAGDLYLLVGTIDLNEVLTVYRYDSVGGAPPDPLSETQLFTTSPRKAYVTDVELAADGTLYMLDRRCQDILVATDSGTDDWPDDYQTTPFAMSDDHPDLLLVNDLQLEGTGVVRGWQMSWKVRGRDRWSTHWRMEDLDSDNEADTVDEIDPRKAPLETLGIPFDGQDEILVRGQPGANIEIWELDADLNKETLLESATLDSDWGDWTPVSLTTALTEGQLIAAVYDDDDDSLTFETVWADWPQVTEYENVVFRIDPAVGGTMEIRGYNFVSDMIVEMTSGDGTLYDLTVNYIDANNATVTIPTLTTDELGVCIFLTLDPDQEEGDGASVGQVSICEEEAE